jgi:hypothetical protein
LHIMLCSRFKTMSIESDWHGIMFEELYGNWRWPALIEK